MIRVRFLRQMDNYNEGEVAGFTDPSVVEAWLDKKVVVLLDEKGLPVNPAPGVAVVMLTPSDPSNYPAPPHTQEPDDPAFQGTIPPRPEQFPGTVGPSSVDIAPAVSNTAAVPTGEVVPSLTDQMKPPPGAMTEPPETVPYTATEAPTEKPLAEAKPLLSAAGPVVPAAQRPLAKPTLTTVKPSK